MLQWYKLLYCADACNEIKYWLINIFLCLHKNIHEVFLLQPIMACSASTGTFDWCNDVIMRMVWHEVIFHEKIVTENIYYNYIPVYQSHSISECIACVLCIFVGGLWRGSLWEEAFVLSVYHRWAPSCLSLCKIWMKLDNPRPSYSDLSKWTWPPSTILDIRGGRTRITPHIVGPHFLCTHQIW